MIQKKRLHYSLIGVLLLTLAVISVNAAVNKNAPWQSESNISGVFNGQSRTLQQAIDQNLLINNKISRKTLENPLTKIDPGHSLSEIWISIKEGGVRKEMSLRDAFSSPRNLCGDTDFVGYNQLENPSHPATEIEVTTSTGTKSLQEAINAKEVLHTLNYVNTCNNNDLYNADSCGRIGSLNTSCGYQYEPWNDWTCIDSNTRQKTRTVHKLGCSNNACNSIWATTTTETVTRDCTGAYPICDGGDCATDWYPELVAYAWGDQDSNYGCQKYLDVNNCPNDLCYFDEGPTSPAGYTAGFTESTCAVYSSQIVLDYDMTYCAHENYGGCGVLEDYFDIPFGIGTPCTLIKSRYRYINCRTPDQI